MWLEAIGEVDDKGIRTVYDRLNGQHRRSSSVTTPQGAKSGARRRHSNPAQVAAPFAGVVTLQVEQGAQVQAGQTVATIEAMKMEAAITSSVSGVVAQVVVEPGATVEGGDLLLTLAMTATS